MQLGPKQAPLYALVLCVLTTLIAARAGTQTAGRLYQPTQIQQSAQELGADQIKITELSQPPSEVHEGINYKIENFRPDCSINPDAGLGHMPNFVATPGYSRILETTRLDGRSAHGAFGNKLTIYPGISSPGTITVRVDLGPHLLFADGSQTQNVSFSTQGHATLIYLVQGSSISPRCDASLKSGGGNVTKETTKSVSGCQTAQAQLSSSQLEKSEPEQAFVRNQTCIVQASCDGEGRNTIKNRAWINTVISDFVTPFANRTGDWRQVIEDCEDDNMPLEISRFSCQNEMADYHISVDLQNTLNNDGCGSDGDWSALASLLAQCIKTGANEDTMSPLQGVTRAFATQMVILKRDAVRKACVQYRQGHGIPIDVAPGIR